MGLIDYFNLDGAIYIEESEFNDDDTIYSVRKYLEDFKDNWPRIIKEIEQVYLENDITYYRRYVNVQIKKLDELQLGYKSVPESKIKDWFLRYGQYYLNFDSILNLGSDSDLYKILSLDERDQHHINSIEIQELQIEFFAFSKIQTKLMIVDYLNRFLENQEEPNKRTFIDFFNSPWKDENFLISIKKTFYTNSKRKGKGWAIMFYLLVVNGIIRKKDVDRELFKLWYDFIEEEYELTESFQGIYKHLETKSPEIGFKTFIKDKDSDFLNLEKGFNTISELFKNR